MNSQKTFQIPSLQTKHGLSIGSILEKITRIPFLLTWFNFNPGMDK